MSEPKEYVPCVPPEIPSHLEQFEPGATTLDGHEASDDPHKKQIASLPTDGGVGYSNTTEQEE